MANIANPANPVDSPDRANSANLHLASLKPGQAAVISTLETHPALHQRLLALGFRQGRLVTLLRRSWLAGPVHVRVGTTEVMLRRQDAYRIKIAPLSMDDAGLTGEAL